MLSDSSRPEFEARIAALEKRLSNLDAERTALTLELQALRQVRVVSALPALPPITVSGPATQIAANQLSPEAKLALYRRLFRGREDVYARRWESFKTNRSGYSPVCEGEWEASKKDPKDRKYLPLTDAVIRNHLRGEDPERRGRDFVVGIYPLLIDETCWFLAADFDKTTWREDARAFLETCHSHGVTAAMERSRSGNGAHVWLFFCEPVPAGLARKLGAFLLTRTMERRPEIGLDSYDRFFPNQDTMPSGGFGNLVALPLQYRPRQNGNSVFVNERLEPYADQIAFLASLMPMPLHVVVETVENAIRLGQVVGVRMANTESDEDEPWSAPPSRQSPLPKITGSLPERISVVLGNQVYVPKEGLPPALINRLIRTAAFQNPEFYQAQAMRFSTFGKPRIIACAEDFPRHIGLPRGCLEEVLELFRSLGIQTDLKDERMQGVPLLVTFTGRLKTEQEVAARHLLAHHIGVLAATTAFGKTVVAAHLIAQRGVNTLVLVHRRQLLDQWIERLIEFLNIDRKQIGQTGAGKRKTTGILDVALIQSLYRKGVVDDVVGQYGHLVVDECHHLSAQSFEQVARACKARFVTGLSATTIRKDGHHPIIFMQCGPIRYRVDARQRGAIAEQLAGIPDREERVLLSTGRYLGEGFDDARLDTLFLTMPISWRGTLAQYAGRLHRLQDSKTEVVIYDYADLKVPVLARMHEKRLAGYRAIGYQATRTEEAREE